MTDTEHDTANPRGSRSFFEKWLPEIMALLAVANTTLIVAFVGREAWGIVLFTVLFLGWAVYVRYDVGYTTEEDTQ